MRYLYDLLRGATSAGLEPNRLVGEHKITLTANEVLGAGSWDSIVSLVSTSLFRSIENHRNSEKLMRALDSKLNLDVDWACVTAAMPYIELRHLLVHSNGEADSDYCRRFPDMGATEGRKVSVAFSTVTMVRKSVDELVREFDRAAVRAGICPTADLQP